MFISLPSVISVHSEMIPKHFGRPKTSHDVKVDVDALGKQDLSRVEKEGHNTWQ